MSTTKIELQTAQKSYLEQSVELALANVFDMAMVQFEIGNLKRSLEFLSLILKDSPAHLNANYLSALINVKVGDIELALPHIEFCLQISPKSPEFWNLYIDALKASGDQAAVADAVSLRSNFIDDEVQRIDKSDSSTEESGVTAGEMAPKCKNGDKKSRAVFDRLVYLYESKKFAELEKYSKKLISANNNKGFAYRFLGILYMEQSRNEEAHKAMLSSLALLPNDATAHFNFALLNGKLNAFDLAETHYRKAIEIDRHFLPAYNNLGNLLRNDCRFEEAELILRRLVELDPKSAVSHFNLVNVLIQKGSFLLALKEAEAGVNRHPQSADLYNALGSIYFQLSRFADAVVAFDRAIAINPEYADAYNNLGSVYFEQKKYAEARPVLEKAIALNPQMGSALRCLGQIAREIEHDHLEAIRYTRLALELNPFDSVAHSSLLFMLSEFDVLTPSELFEEHRLFGERHEAAWSDTRPTHQNTRDKQRVLKVGFVSGDFYHHAVASFIAPILENLGKSPSFELFAYYSNDKYDDVTARLKPHFDFWHQIDKEEDEQVFQKIVADDIDILFDLSGHTSNNRLLLFARKPAPIAITWIGYPGTSGMRAIDYYFTDEFFLPSGEFEQYFTEKLVRLPASAPFCAHADSPSVNTLPALENNYMTFGSFNRIEKLTDEVIDTWCQLFHRVPNCKLFLASLPSQGGFEYLLEKFARRGMTRDRLILFGRSKMDIFLQQLNRVDVCLDTFPYNGGTTTLHSLWMGVPVLTISGKTVASRTGTSAMSHVGLARMATKSKAEFVEEGVYWSTHLDELAEIRAQLRTRLRNSPIMAPGLIAEHVAASLRVMWRRWCDGLPAISFDSSIEEQ